MVGSAGAPANALRVAADPSTAASAPSVAADEPSGGGDNIGESPVFWGILIGVVVVALAAVGGYFLATELAPDPYVGDFNIDVM